MEFTIDTTEEKFYLQAFNILKLVKPFNQLREREIEALSWFNYYYNIIIKDVNNNHELANKLLLDYDTKIKIVDKMGVNIENLYTLILGLRHKNIFDKSGIKKQYVISPKIIDDITFKFKVNE